MHTYSVTQIPETRASFICIGIKTALHTIKAQYEIMKQKHPYENICVY